MQKVDSVYHSALFIIFYIFSPYLILWSIAQKHQRKPVDPRILGETIVSFQY